jgi:hypothetical protein
LFSAATLATAIWMLRTDRALLAARMRSPPSADQRPRDRFIAALIFVVCGLWYGLIAVDARRFEWTRVPAWAEAASW